MPYPEEDDDEGFADPERFSFDDDAEEDEEDDELEDDELEYDDDDFDDEDDE